MFTAYLLFSGETMIITGEAGGGGIVHACIALTILSSGIETSREQRISNRINPDANFFTLDTNDTLFNPRLIVFGKQDFH